MIASGRSITMFRVFYCLLLIAVITAGCAVKSHEGHHEEHGELSEQEGLSSGNLPGDVSKDTPKGLFTVSTGDIHDYIPDLIAGLPVSCYELLPCLENFTQGIWSELDKSYGSDWWNPLWETLQDVSIGSGRAQRDYEEQSLRNYYLGKTFLASDGAYSERLMDILKLQWDYDEVLYSSSLSEHFSGEEENILRRAIVYSLVLYNDDNLSLYITDAFGNMRPLYLDVYPVEFPFCFSLIENSRNSFRAESFGLVNEVESDDLQITYLNPHEGVYRIIAMRTVKKGCSAGGVAIGDLEETLLEQWRDRPVTKLDRISYDDEAWFGDEYDFAYTYSQTEGTKSIVFLIKDGIVCGIELIDGLDGAMY